MMIQKKMLLALGLACLLPTLCPAVQADRDPATAAMAGTRLAGGVSPAWSAWSNPSALLFSPDKFAAAASWQRWMPSFDGGNAFSLGAACGNDRFAAALAGSFLAGEPYDILSAAGAVTGTFTPSETDFAVGLGIRLAGPWSLSAAVRALGSRLSDSHGYRVFGASLLVNRRLPSLTLSAGIADLGTKADNYAVLPAAGVLSAAWTPMPAGPHSVVCALDAKAYLSGGIAASAGFQYAFREQVFVRAGYRYSDSALDLPTHAAVGLGLKVAGFSLDLSCLFASPTLAGTLLVGLGYSF